MSYVDGYVLPVPKKNLQKYAKIARKAAKIWKEHGAVAYRECAGDDLDVQFGVPFPKVFGSRKTDTIVFAFVVFKSRAHRDRVNKAVMNDPRLAAMCDPKNMPFDCTKMAVGGFKTLVEA